MWLLMSEERVKTIVKDGDTVYMKIFDDGGMEYA